MSVPALQQAAEARRSVYALNKELPVAPDEIVQMAEHAVKHTPSAFHSQSTRVVVLFGAEHEKLWDITAAELQKIIPADKFAATAARLDGFKAAAGSILFFEDQSVVKGLQDKFPSYAAGFPVWSEHTNAMHQYALWTTLAAAGVGANLQHYNPLIDQAVAQAWDIPADWLLRAQMVFGGIAQAPDAKTFGDFAAHTKVFGL